jgi:hypothetical protein
LRAHFKLSQFSQEKQSLVGLLGDGVNVGRPVQLAIDQGAQVLRGHEVSASVEARSRWMTMMMPALLGTFYCVTLSSLQ